MSKDGGGKAIRQHLPNIMRTCYFIKSLPLIIGEGCVFRINFVVLFLEDREGDHIDVGIEDGPYLASVALHETGSCPVYANHLDSITRPKPIHIAVVSEDGNCCWSLSLHHILRQFLEFYILLICKRAQIVLNLHALFSFACDAKPRLAHPCILEIDFGVMSAMNAGEERSFHLGKDF